jgi:hypothetical protein
MCGWSLKNLLLAFLAAREALILVLLPAWLDSMELGVWIVSRLVLAGDAGAHTRAAVASARACLASLIFFDMMIRSFGKS